jgi:hypothetical protein
MATTNFSPAPSGPPPVATRHDHQGVIVTSIERTDPGLVTSYRALYTGLVLDHLGKQGGMTPDMKPVWSGAFLCGPAIPASGATGESGRPRPISPSPATSSWWRPAARRSAPASVT